jgi:hypothetical protein
MKIIYDGSNNRKNHDHGNDLRCLDWEAKWKTNG